MTRLVMESSRLDENLLRLLPDFHVVWHEYLNSQGTKSFGKDTCSIAMSITDVQYLQILTHS